MDAADAYAQQLGVLWEAAGKPAAAAIDHQARAQRPPLRVPSSTWSDWINGRSVPADANTARWLIEDYLRPLANRKSHGHIAPPPRWWEQTRANAKAQRSQGGRPATPRSPTPVVNVPPLVRVGVIPPRADCFQDRQVAAALERSAGNNGEGKVVTCQLLEGTGGVGKTQLAAAYTRHLRDQVEVLVWATASSRPKVIDAYADGAVKLGLADRDDPERAARAFLEWADTGTQPWLIVLDDVHNPADLHQLWPPASPAGTTVVTTRLRDLTPPGLPTARIEVDAFTPVEARSYLTAKLDALVDGQLDPLIHDLEYLPLALAQASAFMLLQDIGCSGYRDLFAERFLAHTVPELDGLPDDHHKIIAATWDLSIDKADQARPAGLARPALQLASMLDPNGIPATVLTSRPALDYLSTYLPDTDASEVTPDMVDETLRVLHRFSLITHDRTATHQEVRVHQLIQRATRENLHAEPDIGPDLYDHLAGIAADALLVSWPEREDDHLGQILRANTTILHTIADLALWHDEVHPVLFRAVGSLGDLGQAAAATLGYAQLATLSRERLGPDHPHTLTTRNNLAAYQGEAGDSMGAVATFEEVLADLLRVYGPHHPDTLATRSNLARWRGEAGELFGGPESSGQTVEAFEELLADRLQVLGPDTPEILITRGHLARWRGEAGDPASAVTAFEELLIDYLKVLGPEHPHTLLVRENILDWRKEAEGTGRAIALGELLADKVRILGSEHPHTLETHRKLAEWMGETGDAAGAAAMIEEALTNRLRTLGPDHPRTLSTRSDLGYWRGQAGDVHGARTAYEALLVDRLRVLGADHPSTLTVRGIVARYLGESGNAAGAAAAFEQLLVDRLRVLGPDHPDVLRNLKLLEMWQRLAGLT